MNNDIETLCEQLRRARKALHLTQAELARRAGIPARTYQRVEAGDTKVQIGTVARAAQSLGLALDLRTRLRPTLDELDDLYADP